MIIHGDAKLIMSAFVKARGQIGATVGKDAKGNFGKYATLAALTEATSDPLAACGLALVQEAQLSDDGVTVASWMIHESGSMLEFISLTMPLTDRKPQAVGSAITYGRRYALASICGIAPDDDDGQAAQDATRPTKPTAQPRPAATVVSNGDVLFTKESSVPTDDELKILGTWKSPKDAYVWAIEVGACDNDFNARAAFKNIVDKHGGSLTNANVAAIYLGFLRDSMAKLERIPVTA